MMSPFFLALSLLSLHILCVSADPDAVVTKTVFLDIEIEGKPAGKIIVGLFGNVVPKTTANFVALATHEVSLNIKVLLTSILDTNVRL